MIRISTCTAVFLVVLRICIGWHFAYEGLTKVNSAYQGKASTEKVFTSENYFRESEGPFGKLIKRQLGDPDQEVIAKLTLNEVSGEPSDASPISRFPDALAKEWDDYFNRYIAQFNVADDKKVEAQEKFDKSKAGFVKWVQGFSDEPKDKKTGDVKRIMLIVKRKAPGINNQSADWDQEMTVAARAAELQKKSDEVKEAYRKMMEVGKDADAAGLRAKKADVNAIRAELQKELDDQTKKMKDTLAKLLDTRATAYATQADNKDAAVTLDAMLTPMADGKNPLGRIWDEYAAFVKDVTPKTTDAQKAEVDEELRSAKYRFDRWLADKDMYSGKELPTKDVAEWRKLYADVKVKKESAHKAIYPQLALLHKPVSEWHKLFAAAMKFFDADNEARALVSRMQAELKTHSDSMRAQLGTPLLGDDRAKGYAAQPDERFLWIFPKHWSLINYIDWSTRWGLLIVGITLMIGLFTRFSCFAAAGFLLLTILTQPSVPWLPAAPMNEGSYLFVNKNVIELVALLAIMTTRSGRWAGLDAVVCRICCRRRES